MATVRVLFIGERNKTNTIIHEHIEYSFDALVLFLPAREFFSGSQKNHPDFQNETDIVIYDLNTSTGQGNVPENLQQIRKSFPDLPLLVTDPYQDEKLTDTLYEAGADTILPVFPTLEEITTALQDILE